MKEFFKFWILLFQTLLLAVILSIVLYYSFEPEEFGKINARVVNGFKTELNK